MDDLYSPNPSGRDVAASRLTPSPQLEAIVSEAGLHVQHISAGQLRVWRSMTADDMPTTRIVFAAFTVDHLASRVRFHVLYDDNDEVRATFSLAGCLLQLESNEIGLDVHKTMQSLIETLLRDFRWAVENLPSVH